MRLLYTSLLRVEDAAIFIWIAVVDARFMSSGGEGLRDLTKEGRGTGIFLLVSAGTAILAIATRNRNEPTLSWTQRSDPRAVAPVPFILGLAIVAGLGVENCGLAEAAAGFIPAFFIAAAAYVLYEKLPSAPLVLRRLMLLPIILAGVSIFNTIVHGLFAEVDDELLTSAGFGVAFFAVFFSAMWYTLFVYSPSLIVEADGSWRTWAARYGVFFIGAAVGLSLSWPEIRG